MFFLAPSLSRVLEAAERHGAGQNSLEDLTATLPEAVAFLNESGHMLALLQDGILRSDEVDEWLNQARLELDAQHKALREIERTAREGKKHGVKDHAERLKASAERLLELYARLQDAEKREQVYSPFAPVDHFIKVGINVLNGHVDPAALQSRLPTVASALNQMAASVDQFRLLYGENPMVDQAGQSLGGLQAGVGAVVGFLEEGDRDALADGLRLLGSGSTVMSALLQQFDKQASAASNFSRHRSLEEFCRALKAYNEDSSRVPESLVRKIWLNLEEVCLHYEREVASLQNLAIFPELENDWKPVWLAVEQLKLVVLATAKQLQELPPFESFELAPLEAALENVTSGIERLWKRLDVEAGRLRGAPQLEGLRELVGRGVKGEVPEQQLREGIEHYHRRQLELIQQLQRDPHSEVNQQMLVLLGMHSVAFETMKAYFHDGDRDHLRRGWAMMEGTLGPLIELGQTISQKAERRVSKGKRAVTCFRCSAQNPNDRRICQACGAVLPVMPEGPVETVDIIGGEPAGGGAPNLARLEAVAGRAEAGTASRVELAEEIDHLLESAEKTRATFQKKLIPLMGKDETLDAYLRFFAGGLGEFVQSLLLMRSFCEGGSLSHLHSGLARVRDVASELEAMKAKIDAALRGR